MTSGLMLSFQTNAVTVYDKDNMRLSLAGKIKAKYYFSDAKQFNGDKTHILLGIRGDTKINEKLNGFAYWQYDFRGNKPENSLVSDSTRIAYVGFAFDSFHQFDYGRNYGILNDIELWTASVIPEFGGWAYGSVDNFMAYRTNNVATYRNKNGFGLSEQLKFALQVQGKSNGDNNREDQIDMRRVGYRSVSHQNGTGVGGSLTYEFENNLTVGASFMSSERTEEQKKDGKGARANGWNLGGRYDDGVYYLAAIYAETNNLTYVGAKEGFARKNRAFEITAQYLFSNGLKPSIAYQRGMGDKLNTGDYDIVNYLDIALIYNINLNFSVVAEYRLNLLKDNEFTKENSMVTDDTLNLTLAYTF